MSPEPYSIFCLDLDCPWHIDWLLYIPSQPIALFFTFVCVCSIALYFKQKRPGVYFSLANIQEGISAPLMLLIPLVHRYSITFDDKGKASSSYFMSRYFNLLYMFMVIYTNYQLHIYKDPKDKPISTTMLTVEILLRSLMPLLAVCGTLSMYNDVVIYSLTLFFSLILWSAVKETKKVIQGLQAYPRTQKTYCQAKLMVPVCVLLLVWSVFMLARLYLPLSSVVRTSEALYYLLNYVPSILLAAYFPWYKSQLEKEMESATTDNQKRLDEMKV